MKTISVTKARSDFYDLVEQVSRKRKRIGITNKGETKAVLISLDELDSIEETLDILSDPNALKEIREAEKEYKKGNYYTLEEVMKEIELKRQGGRRYKTGGYHKANV